MIVVIWFMLCFNLLFCYIFLCFIYFEYFLNKVFNNLKFCLTLFKFFFIFMLFILCLIIYLLGLLMSIKMFMDVSIVMGNVIIIYMLSLIAVLMNGMLYGIYLGSIVLDMFYFIIILSLKSFLCIMCLVECFSMVFQSLTLSNSLTINCLAEFMLSYLVGGICLKYFIFLFNYFSIVLFGILTLFFQLFIFIMLSMEYIL